MTYLLNLNYDIYTEIANYLSLTYICILRNTCTKLYNIYNNYNITNIILKLDNYDKYSKKELCKNIKDFGCSNKEIAQLKYIITLDKPSHDLYRAIKQTKEWITLITTTLFTYKYIKHYKILLDEHEYKYKNIISKYDKRIAKITNFKNKIKITTTTIKAMNGVIFYKDKYIFIQQIKLFIELQELSYNQIINDYEINVIRLAKLKNILDNLSYCI